MGRGDPEGQQRSQRWQENHNLLFPSCWLHPFDLVSKFSYQPVCTKRPCLVCPSPHPHSSRCSLLAFCPLWVLTSPLPAEILIPAFLTRQTVEVSFRQCPNSHHSHETREVGLSRASAVDSFPDSHSHLLSACPSPSASQGSLEFSPPLPH